MPENPEMHEEWIAKCKKVVQRIDRLLDLNAPDAIIGSEIACLFYSALGYLGEDLTRTFANKLILSGKRYIGRCATCGINKVEPKKCGDPTCLECNNKEIVEFLRYEMENDDE